MPVEVAIAVSALTLELMICLSVTGIVTFIISFFLTINMYIFALSFTVTQLLTRYFADEDNKRYVKTIYFWQKHKFNHAINGFPDSTYSSEREKADNAFLNITEGRRFHETEPPKSTEPKTLKESASKSLLDD